MEETFNISDSTIDRLLNFADTASEDEYLDQVVALVNDQFSARDKRFLLEKIWQVAYADGRIENQEEAFIDRIANAIDMSAAEVENAKTIAQHLR